MVFVNRRDELDVLQRFCAAVRAGAHQRHEAFVGVRRIGKSILLGHYIASKPPAVCVPFQVDEASTSFPVFVLTMLRAAVGAAARHRGLPDLPVGARPVEIVRIAQAVHPALGEAAARAIAAVDERRPDNQNLFVHGLGIPEALARALGEPVLVFADEFQSIVGLASYGPFAGGRGRAREDAERALLQVLRAHVESRPDVGWIVTGSNVRLLSGILNSGPLMGRFNEHPLGPFTAADCAALAEAIWSEMGVQSNDRAVDRVALLTQGHPFYADVVCREAAVIALRLGQAVSASLVDAAFVGAVHRPNGQIHIACDEMYKSLTGHAPGLRGALAAVAHAGTASLATATADLKGDNPSQVYKHLRELVRLGFLQETDEKAYAFVDPVFRYWVTAANDPLTQHPSLLSDAAARKAATHYVEAFLRERENAGPLREAYVRELSRLFAGQRISGRRFGAPGLHLTLPRVTRVDRITAMDDAGEVFGYPSEVELDLHFGDDTPWLAEVKDRTGKATAAEVKLAAKKAAFLRRAHRLADGPTWFVSVNGFDDGALEAARELGVYVSTLRDAEALRAELGTKRAPA